VLPCICVSSKRRRRRHVFLEYVFRYLLRRYWAGCSAPRDSRPGSVLGDPMCTCCVWISYAHVYLLCVNLTHMSVATSPSCTPRPPVCAIGVPPRHAVDSGRAVCPAGGAAEGGSASFWAFARRVTYIRCLLWWPRLGLKAVNCKVSEKWTKNRHLNVLSLNCVSRLSRSGASG
jgi:hypothetical protein